MDGLEFSCPVDVSVSAKLMGSEGCGGGVRVSSNKADNNCEKSRVSISVNSSIERCGVSINKKGAGSSSGASDSSLWRKLMHSHDFVHDRLTKLRVENSSEPPNGGYSPIASPESAESPRKRGKLSRSSSNGTSRRTKLILLDDTVSTLRDNDTKELCGQGTNHSDKTLVVKQRNSCNGRRGDKRISKVPTRIFSTINSATGENAFFGAYGLKPEINDVTKLIEDLSLKKLLDGSYECPSLGKDKMKKLENTNDTLLSVVRNVWSILPTKRPVPSQSSAELDNCLSRTLSSPPSSISATLNGEHIDNVNALDGDLSSSSKDHSVNSEIPSTPLSFPLCDASDVLKRLGLPPPKDLDALLQDASKPSQNSKNNSDQQRSAKQLPPRSGLPHFPWSQAFNGSSRTNSEAAKLLTGKTLCQGRWVRIPDTTMSSPESITNNFANLKSLSFNESLVSPLQKQTITGTKTSQKIIVNTISCHCTGASASTFQKASFVPTDAEPESRDVQDDALSCPQLLAAAQTLCDIAVQSANHNNPNGILRWPKKLSQKSMKARKSKPIEKPLERHVTTVSSLDLNASSNNNNKNHVRKDSAAEHNHHHHPKPSKRLKLSTMENKKGSFPSPSSSAIESDRKHSSSNKFKNHSRLMPPPPPPTRTLQKASTYPQKARKIPGTG